jgi:hypothetical protein
MKRLIEECGSKHCSLAEKLWSILREGLVYTDGCVLLRSQLGLTQPDVRQQFQDETGYECFINHVHLEDILASDDTCVLLDQAFAFANALSALKADAGISEPLEFIISSDEGEVNVRFHSVRLGQGWLADNLEAYEEAVAAIQLGDAKPLGRGAEGTPLKNLCGPQET